jgi:hypothetical protein
MGSDYRPDPYLDPAHQDSDGLVEELRQHGQTAANAWRRAADNLAERVARERAASDRAYADSQRAQSDDGLHGGQDSRAESGLAAADADRAQQVAETTTDPTVQREAQDQAHAAEARSDIAEANARNDMIDAESHESTAQAEEAEAQVEYDSAERREQMTQDLQDRGIDHEVVASRVRADTSQAHPATAVNREQAARAQTMRGHTQRSRSRVQQVRRGGRDQ